VWGAARHLPIHHHRFRIDVDGEVFEETAASVMVANYGTQMGTWIFPPEASGDDGLLDVAVLKAQTFEQVVTLVAASLGAPPRVGGGLTLRRGRRVRVECEDSVPIQLDGDDQGDGHSFEAEIDPGALTVLVPRRLKSFHPVWPPPLDWG
jgi:diacylglycerol kinase family enzyme